MFHPSIRITLLGAALLGALTGTGPGVQGRPGVAGQTAAPKQDQGKGSEGRAEARPQRPEPNAEARRAGAHIASAFPRTKELLTYLERSDEATLQALLRHSSRLTEHREAAALRMAKEHHPELFALISRSKSRKFARAYDSAIRELVADHARILRAKAVGTADYEATLAEWKLRSQVRLVAAQMTVHNQPELQKRLETLLTEAERARRRLIELQIARQQEQIGRLQRRLEQDPERSVQRQLRAITKRIKPEAKNNKRRRR